MGDWSNLPKDLVLEISKRLTMIVDYVRFHALCVSWRSDLSENSHHLPCQLPWLMLPYNRYDDNSHRRFFSLLNSKIYRLKLPEVRGKRCCGSSQGWLVFVEEESPSISLLNPLTRAQIQLLPLTAIPDVLDFRVSQVGNEYVVRSGDGEKTIFSSKHVTSFYMEKVILSKNPKEANYIVMAMFGGMRKLAFYRSGDEKWTIIDEAGKYPAYEDIIYWKEQFYAVNCNGRVVVCDINYTCPKTITIQPPVSICCNCDKKYLVECSGELLLVFRRRKGSMVIYNDGEKGLLLKTLIFNVFKLINNDHQKWVKLNSLGDSMLFLGDNCSLALSAKDFPECKANRIYFTDGHLEGGACTDGKGGGHDLGMFNLEDESIEPFPCSCMVKSRLNIQQAVWVTPSLY